MTTWLLYGEDGHYIGEAEARTAEAAFILYEELTGKQIDPTDITTKESRSNWKVATSNKKMAMTATPSPVRKPLSI